MYIKKYSAKMFNKNKWVEGYYFATHNGSKKHYIAMGGDSGETAKLVLIDPKTLVETGETLVGGD